MCENAHPISLPMKELLSSFKGSRNDLILILQRVQENFGYLPENAMLEVARFLSVPESKVYAAATFYAQFHLQPRGKNIIKVCRGTACHVRGVSKVAGKIKDLLDAGVGETTVDKKFTYEEVACIGACGLAPVMTINDQTFGKLSPEKLEGILKQF